MTDDDAAAREADRAECEAIVSRLRAEDDEYKRSRFPPGADVFAAVAELAAREIETWRSYLCMGDRGHIAKCSDVNERKCDRASSGACPKRSVLGAGWALCQRAIDAGFDENAIYEWSGFEKRGRLRPDPLRPEYKDAFRRLVEEFANSRYIIALSGDTGTGKTMASSALAIIRGARMVTAQHVLTVNRFDGSFDALCEVPALVIDDVGAEYLDSKGEAEARWDGLFNRRYRLARMNGWPLVLTCNLTAADFKARYGPRVADRIREVGKWINVGGTSMRRK